MLPSFKKYEQNQELMTVDLTWNDPIIFHSSIHLYILIINETTLFLNAFVHTVTVPNIFFFFFFFLTGSLKRTLEEDEDFGSMQVTAAQNG